MQELWLKDNNLTSIPPEIGHCKLLKRMCAPVTILAADLLSVSCYASGMKIELELAARLLRNRQNSCACLSLKVDLEGHWRLTCWRLACGICRWLENNCLETLPEELGECIAIQELYLDNNDLRHLPPSIAALPSLRKL